MFTFVRDLHPKTAQPSMVFTDDGISMLTRDEHRQKAYFPISSTDEGTLIFVKDWQLATVYLLMTFIDGGMVIFLSNLQPQKNASPIDSTDGGISMLTSDSHSKKVQEWRTSTEDGIFMLVKMILDDAFYGCESLVSIDLPPSLEEIGKYAFACCTSLEKVYISKSCKFEYDSFPSGVKLIYGWSEVGPYILLRELIKKKRATQRKL